MGRGCTRAQRLQRSVDNRLQRVVSHRRWKAVRTADCARFVQSLCVGGGAPAQSKRCGGAPGDGANFSSLWPAQNHSGRQWRALWRQRRSGSLAPECMVAALGDRGRVCPASSPRRQRCARTNASGLASRCRQAACTQRCGAKTTPSRLDPVLQSSASSRSIGPARSCKDLLAEQSAYAGAIVAGGISLWWQSRRVRNRGHIKWNGRERFIGRAFVGNGGTQNSGRWCPRSLFPAPKRRSGCFTRAICLECDRLQSRDILKPRRVPSPGAKYRGG